MRLSVPDLPKLSSVAPLLLILCMVPGPAEPQSGDPELDRAAAGWDEVFRRMEMPEITPESSFAAYCAERLLRENRLRPGSSAMVLTMGDGRNALYFAELGLEVTNVFFNPSILMFDRIKASVRPGGYLVVEGYGSSRDSVPAQSTAGRALRLAHSRIPGWHLCQRLGRWSTGSGGASPGAEAALRSQGR